jgi:amino-acid N-acetyltransferase
VRNHPGVATSHEIEPIEGLVSHSSTETVIIRPAQLSDVPALLHLVNDYAAKKIMLPRTELELCESLRDFSVAKVKGEIVGCGALHFYTTHIAELRSLAVEPSRTRSGLGAEIAHELIEQARQFGVDVVFAFTYVPHFFEKIGFKYVDRAKLPLKAWKDCLRCPMFNACDEIAMAYFVSPDAEAHMSVEPPAEPYVDGPLQVPTVGLPRVLDK